MKRMLTSPSLRENKAESRQAKRTGCMPGIFFFFHRHHQNHSRKRLPSGKKEKTTTISATTAPAAAGKPTSASQKRVTTADTGEKKALLKRAGSPDIVRSSGGSELRKIAYDVPRSPTLPAEIRRPSSAAGGSSPETPRRPPALVARLMGLDDLPVISPQSAAEKRRKLLGALEKCDEDLKALKRIIDAVRLAESQKSMTAREDCGVAEKGRLSAEPEQPSPVSVLNGITSPSRPTRPQIWRLRQEGDHHEEKTRKKKDAGAGPFFHRASIEGLPLVRHSRRGGGGGGGDGEVGLGREKGGRRWRSTAMEESVEEVWKDGVWEERWEFGKVGVVLEGDIFGDLVEEMVGDLGVWRSPAAVAWPTSFRFCACRRRLRF